MQQQQQQQQQQQIRQYYHPVGVVDHQQVERNNHDDDDANHDDNNSGYGGQQQQQQQLEHQHNANQQQMKQVPGQSSSDHHDNSKNNNHNAPIKIRRKKMTSILPEFLDVIEEENTIRDEDDENDHSFSTRHRNRNNNYDNYDNNNDNNDKDNEQILLYEIDSASSSSASSLSENMIMSVVVQTPGCSGEGSKSCSKVEDEQSSNNDDLLTKVKSDHSTNSKTKSVGGSTSTSTNKFGSPAAAVPVIALPQQHTTNTAKESNTTGGIKPTTNTITTTPATTTTTTTISKTSLLLSSPSKLFGSTPTTTPTTTTTTTTTKAMTTLTSCLDYSFITAYRNLPITLSSESLSSLTNSKSSSLSLSHNNENNNYQYQYQYHSKNTPTLLQKSNHDNTQKNNHNNIGNTSVVFTSSNHTSSSNCSTTSSSNSKNKSSVHSHDSSCYPKDDIRCNVSGRRNRSSYSISSSSTSVDECATTDTTLTIPHTNRNETNTLQLNDNKNKNNNSNNSNNRLLLNLNNNKKEQNQNELDSTTAETTTGSKMSTISTPLGNTNHEPKKGGGDHGPDADTATHIVGQSGGSVDAVNTDSSFVKENYFSESLPMLTEDSILLSNSFISTTDDMMINPESYDFGLSDDFYDIDEDDDDDDEDETSFTSSSTNEDANENNHDEEQQIQSVLSLDESTLEYSSLNDGITTCTPPSTKKIEHRIIINTTDPPQPLVTQNIQQQQQQQVQQLQQQKQQKEQQHEEQLKQETVSLLWGNASIGTKSNQSNHNYDEDEKEEEQDSIGRDHEDIEHRQIVIDRTTEASKDTTKNEVIIRKNMNEGMNNQQNKYDHNNTPDNNKCEKMDHVTHVGDIYLHDENERSKTNENCDENVSSPRRNCIKDATNKSTDEIRSIDINQTKTHNDTDNDKYNKSNDTYILESDNANNDESIDEPIVDGNYYVQDDNQSEDVNDQTDNDNEGDHSYETDISKNYDTNVDTIRNDGKNKNISYDADNDNEGNPNHETASTNNYDDTNEVTDDEMNTNESNTNEDKRYYADYYDEEKEKCETDISDNDDTNIETIEENDCDRGDMNDEENNYYTDDDNDDNETNIEDDNGEETQNDDNYDDPDVDNHDEGNSYYTDEDNDDDDTYETEIVNGVTTDNINRNNVETNNDDCDTTSDDDDNTAQKGSQLATNVSSPNRSGETNYESYNISMYSYQYDDDDDYNNTSPHHHYTKDKLLSNETRNMAKNYNRCCDSDSDDDDGNDHDHESYFSQKDGLNQDDDYDEDIRNRKKTSLSDSRDRNEKKMNIDCTDENDVKEKVKESRSVTTTLQTKNIVRASSSKKRSNKNQPAPVQREQPSLQPRVIGKNKSEGSESKKTKVPIERKPRMDTKRRKQDDDDEIPWRMNPEDSLSDWTLIVHNTTRDTQQKYHVHKNFLGLGPRKSEYFLTLFKEVNQKKTSYNYNNNTSNVNVTKIDLLEPAASTIPLLLDYIYCDKLQLTTSNALCFRFLSQRFGITLLLRTVMKFIQNTLSIDSITSYYIAATQLGDQKIRSVAARHCARNILKIKTTHSIIKYMDPYFFSNIILTMNDILAVSETDRQQLTSNIKDRKQMHVSLVIEEFFIQHKDLLSYEIFSMLTNHHHLKLIHYKAAVTFLVIESELAPMTPSSGRAIETNLKLTALQERCTNILAMKWKELYQSHKSETVMICAKLPPFIVSEVLIKSLEYSKESKPGTSINFRPIPTAESNSLTDAYESENPVIDKINNNIYDRKSKYIPASMQQEVLKQAQIVTSETALSPKVINRDCDDSRNYCQSTYCMSKVSLRVMQIVRGRSASPSRQQPPVNNTGKEVGSIRRNSAAAQKPSNTSQETKESPSNLQMKNEPFYNPVPQTRGREPEREFYSMDSQDDIMSKKGIGRLSCILGGAHKSKRHTQTNESSYQQQTDKMERNMELMSTRMNQYETEIIRLQSLCKEKDQRMDHYVKELQKFQPVPSKRNGKSKKK